MPNDLSRKDKGFSGLSSLITDVTSGNDIHLSSQNFLNESYNKYSESRQSSQSSIESNNIKPRRNVVEVKRSLKNLVLAYSTICLSVLIIIGALFNSKIPEKLRIIDFNQLDLVNSFILLLALCIIAYKELNTGCILDKITLPGILIGILSTAFFDQGNLINHLIASLGGGLTLIVIAMGYSVITKKSGIGGGVIKLIAMLGAFLGIVDVTIIFLSSFVVGIIVESASTIFNKNKKIAFEFGLYICFVAAVNTLFPLKNFVSP